MNTVNRRSFLAALLAVVAALLTDGRFSHVAADPAAARAVPLPMPTANASETLTSTPGKTYLIPVTVKHLGSACTETIYATITVSE